jgi:hypothetical protein
MRGVPFRFSGFARFVMRPVLKILVLAAVVLGLAGVSQAQDHVEILGGYSYLRASIPEAETPPCPPTCTPAAQISQHANLNGWEFAGQFKVLPFLGVVADFDGTYVSLEGAPVHVHTYLFGAQASLPTRVSPFVHAMFGVAQENQGVISPACPGASGQCIASLGSSTSFATALGAGFDIRVAPFLKVRLIQVDYLHTTFHGVGQNVPRISAGIVVHF